MFCSCVSESPAKETTFCSNLVNTHLTLKILKFIKLKGNNPDTELIDIRKVQRHVDFVELENQSIKYTAKRIHL